MKINLSPMNESHIDGILEISNLSFHMPWSRESIENEFRNRLAHYIIAEDEKGKVIGYGGVWIVVDEGDITNIAVHPDYRGQHIGSMILEEMIRVCSSHSVTAMTLEVRKSNMAAQNLYKKFGFIAEAVRPKYYEDNDEDAILMWKRDIGQKQ